MTVPESEPVEETMEPVAETTKESNEAKTGKEAMEVDEEKPAEETKQGANEEKPSEEEEEEKIVPIPPKPEPVKFERREEVYLRKRKDQREKKLNWLERKQKFKKRKTANMAKIKLKTFNFTPPHKSIIQYLRKEAQKKRADRREKITKVVGHWRYRLPEDVPNLLIIVRLKRNEDVHPEFRGIMSRMHLNRMYQAVFKRKTPQLLDDLQRLGDFVTYGAPSPEAVRDLLHRRGKRITFDEDGKGLKVPLTDNRVIEDTLGEYDIICVDDLVEEIIHVGPAFEKCMKFLAAFSVTPPKGKRWNYKRQFRDGGDWGYRPGNKIMELFI